MLAINKVLRRICPGPKGQFKNGSPYLGILTDALRENVHSIKVNHCWPDRGSPGRTAPPSAFQRLPHWTETTRSSPYLSREAEDSRRVDTALFCASAPSPSERTISARINVFLNKCILGMRVKCFGAWRKEHFILAKERGQRRLPERADI